MHKRELVLLMGVSIDGFVAKRDGQHDWGYRGEDPEMTAWKVATLRGAGAHLMGGKTYRDMASVWPQSTSDVGAAMNEIPKVAFSKSLERGDWADTKVASGELTDEVARLKAQDGNYLLAHGGSKFARSLVREGLIDEYRLVIHPAALGDGLPLYSDLPSRLALELVDGRIYSTGAAVHIYRPRQG